MLSLAEGSSLRFCIGYTVSKCIKVMLIHSCIRYSYMGYHVPLVEMVSNSDVMRQSADWMTIWDDRILEYILENEGGGVGEIADHRNFHISNSHVSRRCKKLAEWGLLRPLGNGIYTITSQGKQYLNGELDAAKLDREDESENGVSA